MTTDKPILGISLMLGFCLLAPIGDAIAKVLGDLVPLTHLLVVRFAVQALLLAPLVWSTGRMWRMRGRVLALTLLRTVLHIIGIGAMVTALKYLPLADAVAIVFVMPFFMLLLGYYVLNETVGQRRLLACAVGFAGTLMVVQPSFANVGWPALLPVFVAANFSIFMLVTRQIAKETDPVGLQAVSGGIAMVILLPILFWQGGGPSDFASFSNFSIILMVLIGVVGTLAHLLMTWSLRYAPSATVAPMQYLEIPFATAFGLMFFGELPNLLASIGIVIITGAGLYVMLRERAIAQRALRETAG